MTLTGCRNAICSDRMTKLARLSARWIGNHGFSIGIEDVTPSEQLKKEKARLVKEAYDECDQLLNDFNTGTVARNHVLTLCRKACTLARF